MDLLTGIRLGTTTGLCYFGFIMARSDTSRRRIYNRHVLQLLGLVALIYAASLAAAALGERGLLEGRWYSWGFFRACLLNGLLSACAAVALWRLRIWPSGDAKLFTAVAVALPLITPDLAGFPRTLFCALLFNAFIPAAAYVVAEAVGVAWNRRLRHLAAFLPQIPSWGGRLDYLGQLAWGSVRESARQRWRNSGYGIWYCLYFGLGLVIELLGRFGGRYQFLSGISPFVSIASMWGLNWLVRAAKPTPLRAGFFYAGAAALLAFHPAWLSRLPSVMFRWSLFGLCYWLYSASVNYLEASQKTASDPYVTYDARWIPLYELEPWSLLSRKEWARIEQTDPDFYERHFAGARFADGLTPRQLRLIQAWCKREEIDRVEVQNIIPFAHWILLGALLTLILKKDAISSLLHAGMPGGPR